MCTRCFGAKATKRLFLLRKGHAGEDAPRIVCASSLVTSGILTALAIFAFSTLNEAGFFNLAGSASCLSTNCFCEQPRLGEIGFVQPSNTFSSFFFVVISVLLGHALVRDSRVWIAQLWPLPLIALGVGLCSAVFHATLTFAGQFLDVFAMHALALFVIARSARRSQILSPRVLVVVYALALGCAALLLFYVPETRRYLFACFILGGIGAERWAVKCYGTQISAKYLWFGIACIAAGYVVWLLDNKLIVCAPHSALQGHGVWHLAGAVSIAFLYRYYRSEQTSATK